MDGARRSVNLSGVYLAEADLSGADLRRADLSGANLCSADMRGTNLSWANLTNAILWGANLTDADLGGADLCKATLCFANLTGADLWGADLSGANWDEHTRWPAGYVPPEKEAAPVALDGLLQRLREIRDELEPLVAAAWSGVLLEMALRRVESAMRMLERLERPGEADSDTQTAR